MKYSDGAFLSEVFSFEEGGEVTDGQIWAELRDPPA